MQPASYPSTRSLKIKPQTKGKRPMRRNHKPTDTAKFTSQPEMVAEYLKNHKVIKVWYAITVMRITRLSEIIRRLRARGINIKTVIVEENGSRFAEYHLEE